MRTIAKGPAPASLVRHQGDPRATWDGYADKDAARKALCQEQGYLCAFCGARIEPEDANLKVKLAVSPDRNRGVRCAHWTPQSQDPKLQLVWTNILGSCFGGEGTDDEHCDVAQHDERLHVHPVLGGPAPEAVFTYGSDGSMSGSTAGASADIHTLRLDASQRLRRARREVWRGVYEVLSARKGSLSVVELTQMRDRASIGVGGRLAPFAQVEVYILSRQIQRHGGAGA